MGKVVFSDLITKITGKVGNSIFSSWKGLYTVRSLPATFQYPWTSPFDAPHRLETQILAKSWRDDIDESKRYGWETYAEYLGTLPTDYTKITGWKQYGGTMAGYNAFCLTNSLRFSLGYTDILTDAPNAKLSPIQPTFNSLTLVTSPKNTLVANFTYSEIPPTDTFARLWIKGRRFAHLLLTYVQQVVGGGGGAWQVKYEADKTPPLATPPWTLIGSDYSSVASGICTIGADAHPENHSLYIRSDASIQTILSVEFKVKTKNVAAYTDLYTIMRTGANARYGIDLYITPTAITANYYNGHTVSYHADMQSDFRTIRVQITPGNAKVWLEDVLVMDLTLTEQTGTVSYVQFGRTANQDTEQYVDYLYYSFDDFPSANELPVSVNQLHYTKGQVMDIFKDTYDAQLDCVNEFGRFAPPSDIKTIIVP
jgi:hypothetical protein